MKAAVLAVARLTWKRFWRSRMLWVSAVILLFPPVLALLTTIEPMAAAARWTVVGEWSLRSLTTLLPLAHLAGAVREEAEGKTYSYLWSRPVPREALIFGKMLAITPALAVATVISLAVAFAIVAATQSGVEGAWLGRALFACAAGVVSASAFSVGIGALVPRQPFLAGMAYVFLAEQILPEVEALRNVTTLHHVRVLAALPHDLTAHEGGILGLLVLTAAWLALAVWRVRRVDLGSAEG